MPPPKQKVTGMVTRARVAPSSKSEHVAVVLRTPEGSEYVLRRVGGNAFRDEVLEDLVGKTITGSGSVSGQILILHDWTVKDGS
jgi:hypothetical protein